MQWLTSHIYRKLYQYLVVKNYHIHALLTVSLINCSKERLHSLLFTSGQDQRPSCSQNLWDSGSRTVNDLWFIVCPVDVLIKHFCRAKRLKCWPNWKGVVFLLQKPLHPGGTTGISSITYRTPPLEGFLLLLFSNIWFIHVKITLANVQEMGSSAYFIVKLMIDVIHVPLS